MGSYVHPVTNNVLYSFRRKGAPIPLGKESQVTRRDLERTDCRTVIFAILSMACATAVHVEISRPLVEIAGFFFAAIFEAHKIVSPIGIISLHNKIVVLDIASAPVDL